MSVSTVSNVLNGRRQRMRPATRRRVDRAIARLRYRPSRAARQLRTGHARTIALVVPSVANPYWGTLAVHLETAAMRHGYQVVLCNTERDRRRERAYVDGLWHDGIRDIILGSSLPSLEHIADFMARGLMVVAFGLRPGTDGIQPAASIYVDNHYGATLATRHLLGLGHRRIAFLSDLPRVTSRLERMRGYRDAMAAAGLPADPVLVRARGSAGGSDAGGADGGRSAARRLLLRRPRPTAIVAGNDLCALGTLAAAHELGLSIPDDLSVVGFDDIALARVVTPPLTTVRQPAQAIARMAVEQLLEAPNRSGGIALVVRPRLIARSSTARPSDSLGRRPSSGGSARRELTPASHPAKEMVGSEVSAIRQ